MSRDQRVRSELEAFEASAISAATWTSLDATGRAQYNRLVKRFSTEIWARYQAGDLSAENAARLAQETRNEIMLIVRARSSPYGRARAESLKARGKNLEDLMDRYSRQAYKRSFYELSSEEQGGVYEAIIRAAGRPNANISIQAQRLGMLGRGLWVVTAVTFIWDVTTARDKVERAIRDSADMAAGIVGSMAVGALAGMWLGPVGAIIGGLVGGICGSLFTDSLVSYFEKSSVRTGRR
jgi:hypothetical protein